MGVLATEDFCRSKAEHVEEDEDECFVSSNCFGEGHKKLIVVGVEDITACHIDHKVDLHLPYFHSHNRIAEETGLSRYPHKA